MSIPSQSICIYIAEDSAGVIGENTASERCHKRARDETEQGALPEKAGDVIFEATTAERRTEVDTKILILQYDLDAERQEKESIIKERDALLAEKFEWEREMTLLKAELMNVKTCSCAKDGKNKMITFDAKDVIVLHIDDDVVDIADDAHGANCILYYNRQ
ncbi:hypothetical protein Pcinc_007901 [Petrolisthes cinctipes]|uniref:Uncharacterized protein n=1 Tax=Petrolisthes cinctipes TaxID=88211 RepID=A0AAE1GEE3_PETCI|nr:hypothetical protein Pcinc_007901 [Petrolisthes cinctipes]